MALTRGNRRRGSGKKAKNIEKMKGLHKVNRLTWVKPFSDEVKEETKNFS